MRYRLLGRGSGLRVSSLALGCAMFGTRWGYGADEAECRRMLERYIEVGGNLIDTAGTYQRGQSEELLGALIGSRRDALVLSSKFGLGDGAGAPLQDVGNSRKTMMRSVEKSLERLQTDRLDMLWVHMPDGVTSSEEIMRALDDLVRAGKVLYVGLSDFPAWRVARAATLAELRGWAPVVAIQVEYSLVERTADRDLLPMARALGLSVFGWSPLAGGLLTGKYRQGEEGRATTWGQLVHVEDNERKRIIVDRVIEGAKRLGITPSQAALAWALSKGVNPVLGPRTCGQLDDNLGALDANLPQELLTTLDEASAVSLGFPHEMLPNWNGRLTADLFDLVETPVSPVA